MSVKFSEKQNAAREMLAGPQRFSCVFGGARSGKTFLIVRYILHRGLRAPGSRHAMLRLRNNAARASLSLDTLPKVASLCGFKIKEHRQDGFFELLDSGSQIWVGGLDDKERVEKILGQEYATIYLNEASQIPYSSYLVVRTRLAQMVADVEKGSPLKQRMIVDLNPVGKSHWTNCLFQQKIDPVSRKPLFDPENYVSARVNPIDNAHNLSKEFLADLAGLPEKQRKRFYEGVYVDEVDGALWSYDLIEELRCAPEDIPVEQRAAVVIAVDPSGAAGKADESNDDIGIIAAARGQDSHGYVLADRSCREAPAVWARRAVSAYHEFQADCIVAESNFGGEMVRATIHSVDPNVPVHLVTASRGKVIRAEPIATRYAQKQVHHVGRFGKLEDQLCAFSSAGYMGADSPDHADAAVWALTYLFNAGDTTGMIEYYRALAEENKRAAPPDPYGYSLSVKDSGEKVRLYVPEGISVAYGMTGARYMPDADGIVAVAFDDAPPLRNAGFIDVPKEV